MTRFSRCMTAPTIGHVEPSQFAFSDSSPQWCSAVRPSASVTERLRRLYRAIEQEPIPEPILALLRRLDD